MGKKKLYIIGGGGYGREIASYLNDFSEKERDWVFKGFIDDNRNALEKVETQNEIVGGINNFQFDKEDYVIIAIGNIKLKKQIIEKLRDKVTFYTFVAKNSYVGSNVKLGEGVVLCPGVKLPANITLGDFVSINIDSRIGHDSVIGNNCSIMPNVDIGGECVIGENVFFGTKSTIIPRTIIEADNHIGVAAVILKDIITKQGTYFGNPARKMR